MTATDASSRCPAVDVHGHRCALGDVRAAHTRGRHEADEQTPVGEVRSMWPLDAADEARWLPTTSADTALDQARKDVDDADRAFREVTERWRTEKARARAAEARLAAVEALHRPSTDTPGPEFEPYCEGCWEAGGMDGAPTWPCPTMRALAGEGQP